MLIHIFQQKLYIMFRNRNEKQDLFLFNTGNENGQLCMRITSISKHKH